ncbi:MAG: hypothetical protein E5W13_15915 [Mesorhizobium sp.]|nr:MAG: hypothetical protein E5W13_15915 [Mesorhizobium sp.]
MPPAGLDSRSRQHQEKRDAKRYGNTGCPLRASASLRPESPKQREHGAYSSRSHFATIAYSQAQLFDAGQWLPLPLVAAAVLIGVDAGSQQTRPKAETCGRSGKDEPAKKQKSHFRRGAGRIQNPTGC